jgi:formylglycine-generating enzyme required for sulfatase activity
MPEPSLPRLRSLGFETRVLRGVECIIPPMGNVPAGPFIMGSNLHHETGVRVSEFEMPQHAVDLPAFDIAVYPVTVAEYACAVNASDLPEPQVPAWDRKDYGWQAQKQGLDSPFVFVSWGDAVTYTHWLSDLTDQVWRLPTEAEWEQAARGTDGRMFPWGNLWDDARANTLDGGVGRLAPVGAYPAGASPYGIQDMAGNVYEWCYSHLAPYPYQAGDGREESESPFNRITRGGCWDVD